MYGHYGTSVMLHLIKQPGGTVESAELFCKMMLLCHAVWNLLQLQLLSNFVNLAYTGDGGSQQQKQSSSETTLRRLQLHSLSCYLHKWCCGDFSATSKISSFCCSQHYLTLSCISDIEIRLRSIGSLVSRGKTNLQHQQPSGDANGLCSQTLQKGSAIPANVVCTQTLASSWLSFYAQHLQDC